MPNGTTTIVLNGHGSYRTNVMKPALHNAYNLIFLCGIGKLWTVQDHNRFLEAITLVDPSGRNDFIDKIQEPTMAASEVPLEHYLQPIFDRHPSMLSLPGLGKLHPELNSRFTSYIAMPLNLQKTHGKAKSLAENCNLLVDFDKIAAQKGAVSNNAYLSHENLLSINLLPSSHGKEISMPLSYLLNEILPRLKIAFAIQPNNSRDTDEVSTSKILGVFLDYTDDLGAKEGFFKKSCPEQWNEGDAYLELGISGNANIIWDTCREEGVGVHDGESYPIRRMSHISMNADSERDESMSASSTTPSDIFSDIEEERPPIAIDGALDLQSMQQKMEAQVEVVIARAINMAKLSGDDTSDPGILLKIANTLNDHQYIPAAKKLYQQVLEIKPEDAAANNNLGEIYRSHEDYENALLHHRKALETRIKSHDHSHNYTDIAISYYNMGLVLSAIGRSEDAIISYSHAAKIKPDYVEKCTSAIVKVLDHNPDKTLAPTEQNDATSTASVRSPQSENQKIKSTLIYYGKLGEILDQCLIQSEMNPGKQVNNIVLNYLTQDGFCYSYAYTLAIASGLAQLETGDEEVKGKTPHTKSIGTQLNELGDGTQITATSTATPMTPDAATSARVELKNSHCSEHQNLTLEEELDALFASDRHEHCDHKDAYLTMKQVDDRTDAKYRAHGLQDNVIVMSHKYTESCKARDVFNDYHHPKESGKFMKSESQKIVDAAADKKLLAAYCQASASHGHLEFLVPYGLCARSLGIDIPHDYARIDIGIVGDIYDIIDTDEE